MLVSRTTTKQVTKCKDCPFFNYHPHEPSCDKLESIGYTGWDNIVPRDSVDERCPFK